MPVEKKKQSFGGVQVARVRPAPTDQNPKAMHVILSLEEALKLRLSLDQVLLKLNSYNRARREGRRGAVDVCIYPSRRRLVIFEGKLPKPAAASTRQPAE
jgi:hypothetical protein